jgi:four helix bundle protein
MNDRTQQLLDRTFDFGVNTLKFLKKLPDDFIYRIPKGQVARSSISIGANYEETQGAVSKRDFSNKVGISYKEARESLYWLRILQKLYDEDKYQKDFELFIKESQELKNIFAAIKKSSKEVISQ